MNKSTKSLFSVRIGIYKKRAKTTEVKLIRRPGAEARGMKTSLSLKNMIRINRFIKMNVQGLLTKWDASAYLQNGTLCFD